MALSDSYLRGSTTFHGVRVSQAHRIVLQAAERAGIAFRLNDGQRNEADQRARIAKHGIWNAVTNPHGAAPYSPNAPHVKAGRANHANDVEMWNPAGGHLRLAAFYRSHGCPVLFNVPTEGWHLDPPDERALLRAARNLGDDPLHGYPADEVRWIREYDALRRLKRQTTEQKKRAKVLRTVMRARRRSIWRAAQVSGWNKLRRRDRYASLYARTR